MESVENVIRSAIAQRKKLLIIDKNGKNKMKCFQIIQQLELQMQAYKSVWDESGWKCFLDRNRANILYLIPGSKSGETIKQKIYEIH